MQVFLSLHRTHTSALHICTSRYCVQTASWPCRLAHCTMCDCSNSCTAAGWPALHTSTPQIVQKYLYALLTYQHTTKSAIVPLCAAAASLEDCFSCSSLQSHPPALSAIFRCRESEAPCTQAQVSPCTNSKVFVHKQWSVFAHAYTCSTSSLLRAYYPLQKSTNSQSLLTCRHKFKCLCTQAQVSPKHMRTSLSGGFSKEKKLFFFMPPPKRSCSCNGKSQGVSYGRKQASKEEKKKENPTFC